MSSAKPKFAFNDNSPLAQHGVDDRMGFNAFLKNVRIEKNMTTAPLDIAQSPEISSEVSLRNHPIIAVSKVIAIAGLVATILIACALSINIR